MKRFILLIKTHQYEMTEKHFWLLPWSSRTSCLLFKHLSSSDISFVIVFNWRYLFGLSTIDLLMFCIVRRLSKINIAKFLLWNIFLLVHSNTLSAVNPGNIIAIFVIKGASKVWMLHVKWIKIVKWNPRYLSRKQK